MLRLITLPGHFRGFGRNRIYAFICLRPPGERSGLRCVSLKRPRVTGVPSVAVPPSESLTIKERDVFCTDSKRRCLGFICVYLTLNVPGIFLVAFSLNKVKQRELAFLC